MDLSNFTIIITECHQGQKKLGVKEGGHYLYKHIISQKTKHPPKYYPEEKFNTPKGYLELYNECSTIDYPLVLGGDHSIGTSTVLASLKKYSGNLTDFNQSVSPYCLSSIWKNCNLDRCPCRYKYNKNIKEW